VKAVTHEQLRILVAAAEGRLRFVSASYRYKIDGEDPPDRRERERLQKRGLLSRRSPGRAVLTERGREALATAPMKDSNGGPPATQMMLTDATKGRT
jgi:hypothetical protein